ncbi:MAG: response regulator [SAR324 cluster bacterium]|nr:response regulator [SAR324 cluster bacterium]
MQHILVIDDEENIRFMMQEALVNAGYQVTITANGKEAERLYTRQTFDLVITDIFMPEKEGFEVMLELLSVNPDSKIIAITGGGIMTKETVLKMAEEFGAVHCLSKPFLISDLIKIIRNLLNPQ